MAVSVSLYTGHWLSLEPLERVPRTELLPAFLGVSKSDIMLAIAVKRGMEIRNRNPLATAEEFFEASCHTCNYLVESPLSPVASLI